MFVCVDVGSTYTKAAAVDVDTGELLATASTQTTLATDVMDGLRHVAGEVSAEARVADTLVCSSAGGGLKLGVIGNEPLVTARAAYRAGLSAGARVAHVCAGQLDADDFATLATAEPDVILLAGGTNGGDASVLLEHTDALAAATKNHAQLRVPVVVAGNADVADEVRTKLQTAGLPVRCVDNVLPKIGHLTPGPARLALRETFLQHVIAGKELSAGDDFVSLVRAATPDAVLAGVELLADTANTDLLVVDVGGATTDVYSVLTPDAELEGPRAEVAGTAWRSRTVEGDLGVRHTATGIVEAAQDEDLLQPDEADTLTTAARYRYDNPEYRADTDAERAVDARLTSLAAGIAVRRHARGERIGGPSEPLRGSKDLAAVDLVIGSGGVLRGNPVAALGWLRSSVCNDTAGGFRPARDAKVAVDANYVLAPAGLIATAGHTETAQRLLHHERGSWNDYGSFQEKPVT
ncbi:glutamate mutase L [Natronoglycomyces albus]|uniref:Glutamate mutase L n=1 Tax=Natronoglycomyces albus TaxID=2811108 RepID=A0A895XUP5_9ACTN|nr:glutamate mutase L [Natronoglycomyces albus]